MSNSEQTSSQLTDDSRDFPKSTLSATVGGIIGLACAVFVFFALQRIFQELPFYQLIDAMHGTSTTLCFAGISASSTIMPLMLTIFSFARHGEVDFNPRFYARIKHIALLCCAAFIAGLFTLTVLSAPIGDMTQVSMEWYRVLYYIIVFGLSSMVGLLVAILILLYYAILHIVDQLNPHRLRKRMEHKKANSG